MANKMVDKKEFSLSKADILRVCGGWVTLKRKAPKPPTNYLMAIVAPNHGWERGVWGWCPPVKGFLAVPP